MTSDKKRRTPKTSSKTRIAPPKPSARAPSRTVEADIPAPRRTKAALLREMLAAPGGASLGALCQATGWQSHTVRAALTAIRKSGTEVERHRADGVTTYTLATGAVPSASEAAQ